MAENTGIGWTDHTTNFWWGCFKVSPGCANCYAETLSKRTGRDIWGPPETTERWKTKSPWLNIVKWDQRAAETGVRERVFVQSMSDLFEPHPQVRQWRNKALKILENCIHLDIQLLTKRIELVKDMIPAHWKAPHGTWPSHIWLGTSVEDQQRADGRVLDLLKHVSAPIRFLSVEPMLAPIKLRPYWLGDIYESQVDWVIIGGESSQPRNSNNARPFHLEWAFDIIEMCRKYDVPVFVKQLGDNPYFKNKQMKGISPKGEIMEEWPEGLRIQEFPS